MNRYFLLYEDALALKELGFDEPCLSDYLYHRDNKKFVLISPDYWYEQNIEQYDRVGDKRIPAPLYQQAFEWFRDEHGLDIIERPQIGKTKKYICDPVGHKLEAKDSFLEARLTCIRKLIEIVKTKNKEHTSKI